LALVGCGSEGHPKPLPHPPVASVGFVEPESAYTPEGAQPAPPPRFALTAPGERSIDAAGVNLIGGFEGFSSCPYRDVVGVWTIGYGVTSGSGIFVGPGTRCESRATGLAQLRQLIVTRYEPAVHAVSRTFGQHALDALDSFDFNLGAGIFTGALRADLAAHAYFAAGNIMLGYDHAGGRVIEGLRTRREAEVRLLREPDASPPQPTHAQLEAQLRAAEAKRAGIRSAINHYRILIDRHRCRLDAKGHMRPLPDTHHQWGVCEGWLAKGNAEHRAGAQVNQTIAALKREL
jgi:lysozyme